MSVIRATKGKENVTRIQPDEYTAQTVQELKDKGYENIHNAETGEKYK